MSHEVDFLRSPRPPLIGWALLAAGLIALSTATWQRWLWTEQRAGIERRELEVRSALKAPRTHAEPVEPTASQRRWITGQRELRRPWLPALRAIESATANPVFLLSLTIDPDKGLIRMEGEAPSFDHALAYVQLLDEGGVLSPAMLLSHERIPGAGSADGLVKFSAETTWVNR